MNTLISKLLMILNSDAKESLNYTIAKYILDHILEVKDMPVNQLAEACHSSSNSIRRFCNALGYDSYTRLKEALVSSMRTRSAQIEERFSLYDPDEMYRHLEVIVPQKDLNELKEEVSRAARMVHGFETVAFCGANYPLMLTLNFQEDLIMFGKKVNVHTFTSNTIHEAQLNEQELLFVITLTGRLLSLNPANKNILSRHSSHIILVSQLGGFSQDENHIRIPGTEDDERNNVLLLYIFNLIKYTYWKTYIKKAG